jgi:hemolysin III
MYGSSTLYHAITQEKAKKIFQIFDHLSIYLLIAGSYTPITLVSLQGVLGYSIATTIWATAFFGIYMKVAYPNRFETLSLILYIIMGWSIVVAYEPLSQVMQSGGIYLLVAGGLSYTLGVFFYINDDKNFYHAIWHMFVLGGSVCHFFMTLFYII